MTTIHLQVAPRVGPVHPFGSRLAAALFLGGARLLTTVLRSLTRPLRRSPASPTEEARAVRELALQVQATDPRFAADLLAAADRHERVHAAG